MAGCEFRRGLVHGVVEQQRLEAGARQHGGRRGEGIGGPRTDAGLDPSERSASGLRRLVGRVEEEAPDGVARAAAVAVEHGARVGEGSGVRAERAGGDVGDVIAGHVGNRQQQDLPPGPRPRPAARP